MNTNGFFTVGGPAVTKADVKIPNEMVKFRSAFSKNVPSISNFLINSNNELHAIGLLYDNMNSFKDIVLSQKQQFIPINDRVAETLSKYLVDLGWFQVQPYKFIGPYKIFKLIQCGCSYHIMS